MIPTEPAGREFGKRAGLNAVVTGVLLGLLQWGVLVWLASYLSSTALVYLLSTVIWLGGSVFGLLARGRGFEWAWLGAAMAAYAACRALAAARPYDLSVLPALLLCVAVMGAYAGRFYRFRAPCFANVKWLLFLENTGFVLGLLVAVAALFVFGERALWTLPWGFAALALATAWGLDQARGASVPEGARLASAAADLRRSSTTGTTPTRGA
jgi:hypothetical protein